MELQQSKNRGIPKIIRKISEKIVKNLSPEKVILFGSYAYGNVNFDSDVDLLIILDTKLKGAERQRLVSRLIRPRPFPVDIIVKTPEEIRESRNRVDPFLNEILEKGIVLYGKII